MARRRHRRAQPERQLQANVIAHLPYRLLPDLFWRYQPAAGRRSRITGAILKTVGDRPGPRDILLLTRARSFRLWLKSYAGRTLQEHKVRWRADTARGHDVARQHGVPLDVIRRALMRDRQCHPNGPVGIALDLLSREGAP
jgi:hypothetical protein